MFRGARTAVFLGFEGFFFKARPAALAAEEGGSSEGASGPPGAPAPRRLEAVEQAARPRAGQRLDAMRLAFLFAELRDAAVRA